MERIEVIDTPADLETLARELDGTPVIAVDTEFIRERTYYPRGCLLQLAWGEQIACVDLLALGGIGALSWLFFDSQSLKVFHAARQDLELFYAMDGRVPSPVTDTQIAGALLGYPDQSGYATLVEATLGVQLDKQHARTDWSRRPLSDAQLQYAVDDVRYLLQMHRLLEQDLMSKGRQEWARDLYESLCQPALYAPDPGSAWRRVKNWAQLGGPPLARLQALAAWREDLAVERDRPRRWILSDEALIHLARHNPATTDAVGNSGLPAAVVRRHAATIVALLATVDEDAAPVDVPNTDRLTRGQTGLARRLAAQLDEVAEDQKVAAAVLATRSDLRDLVRGRRDLAVLTGWRLELVGRQLLGILDSG
jgi:ribonuclease D